MANVYLIFSKSTILKGEKHCNRLKVLGFSSIFFKQTIEPIFLKLVSWFIDIWLSEAGMFWVPLGSVYS